MQVRKARAIGVDGEHCAFAVNAAIKRRPIQSVARYNQAGHRPGSVAVGGAPGRPAIRNIGCRENVQDRKTRAIRVEGEDRATAICAAPRCRPIQGVARQNQSGTRKSSVAAASETIQVRKARAVGADGEHRPPAPTASATRRPIKGVAR